MEYVGRDDRHRSSNYLPKRPGMPAEMATTDDEADEPGTETGTDIEEADGHLAEISDGAGCTEIWEHLSRRRTGDDD